MAATVTIDPTGKECSWTLSVSHLKVGVYRAILFNKENEAVEEWKNQRTDDNIPDTFPIKTKPAKLKGAVLYWECIASDPGDQGGPYVCTVSVSQGSSVLAQDPVASSVPAGNGKLDSTGDQITFA